MNHPMMSLIFAVLASSMPSGVLAADESEIAALRLIGAEVKQSDGVITSINVNCQDFDDSDYQLIGSLTSLKSLTIGGHPSTLTDEHLQMLTGLKDLESIQLDGAVLSDEGFRHFTAFTKLKRLSLFHPSRDRDDFTGTGLAYLKSLPELERLTFAGATAGDEAMRAVGQLTQLREFAQWHNWDSAAGIEYLKNLPHLKSLKIGQRLPGGGRSNEPSFDDQTLAIISQIKSLERLDLQEARLSFAGLLQLNALPALRELNMKWVDVPAGDVEKLRQSLPAVELQWTAITPDERKSILEKKMKL